MCRFMALLPVALVVLETCPLFSHTRSVSENAKLDYVRSAAWRSNSEHNAAGSFDGSVRIGTLIALAVPLPQPPKSWERNRIDAYVLARMKERNLTPSPEASRAVLARRASLTLTGLPLSFEQRKRFLDDKGVNAYEALVDRLLKSKAHREYWSLIAGHHEKPTNVRKAPHAAVWASVLWQQVFGRKLKQTSHPRLKGYLTALVKTKDDTKLLRLLVTSATFRQSSDIAPDLLATDKDNEWLTRYPQSRVPIWVLHRSMLFLSGLSPEEAKLIPERDLKPAPKKQPTNLPVSSLHLASQECLQRASAGIARKILTNAGKSDEDRFRYAALLILGRPPTNPEKTQVSKLIAKLRKHYADKEELRRRNEKLDIQLPGDLLEATVWMDLSMVLFNTLEFVSKR